MIYLTKVENYETYNGKNIPKIMIKNEKLLINNKEVDYVNIWEFPSTPELMDEVMNYYPDDTIFVPYKNGLIGFNNENIKEFGDISIIDKVIYHKDTLIVYDYDGSIFELITI